MNELIKVARHYGLIDSVTSGNIKIMCPFHQDKRPSLLLDFEKDSFYCFGCAKSGNAFDFVKGMEEKDDIQCFLLYLKILKDCTEVEVRKTYKPQGREALNIAKNFYVNLKTDDWTKENEHEEELQYMLKRGFTREILTEIGMKYNYEPDYPLIFPIRDNGVIKGWVCRAIDKEVESYRKYLYNTGFRRRTCLCGYYEKGKPLYLVEGYMDMLKARMHGLENVCAIMGWKLSDEQIEKIKKTEPSIIVSALDNDPSGQKGHKYIKSIFPNAVRWAYLKGVKDLGESDKKMFDKMYNETKKRVEKHLTDTKRSGIIKQKERNKD